ncbi:MAG TPA: HEAT repeat domain-containing protein, partial [Tepidisphaeraceae bacterium]|nr:HEAT repeat domain-containing protein [Tepidisphaeraceae bacterium]
ASFQGRMFGADPLHHNIMVSERYALGSTFETSDTGPALSSPDVTFRPVYLTTGPDGAIYIADFCEEFIAHGQNYQGQIDPTTGRIYRLRGKDMALGTDTNLAEKTTAQLVETLSHPNRWHRQTAVRVLGERHDPSAVQPLKALLQGTQTHPALEALWTLHQMGALDEQTAQSLLNHPSGPVRAWVVRLLGDENRLPDPFIESLLKRIPTETDAEVRSQIACTSRRLPAQQGLALVSALLKRDADASDPGIPLLCWWTIESHCDSHRDAVMSLLKEPADWDSGPMKQEILSRLMRRFASKGTNADYLACAKLLDSAPAAEHRKLLVAGFEAAFKGRAMPALPQELVAALAKSGEASPLLRARLGDADAVKTELKIAADSKAKHDDRLGSITLFGDIKTPQAAPALLGIVASESASDLRKAALTALLQYSDDKIGEQVAASYAKLPASVRPAAINLLASRANWNVALLNLVQDGTLKPAEVPADVVTRMRLQNDPQTLPLLQKLFPAPHAAPKTSRMPEVMRVRKIIESGTGDPYKGEATFMQRCATCHTLFHKGGNIGPNLTSYQRDDLGTMLISIVDPSAEIREGFQNYILKTKDGRTLSGFLSDNDPQVVALRGLDGQDVHVPKTDVAELTAVPTSIMPEGLLEGLGDQEMRDFFAYLRIPQPISK